MQGLSSLSSRVFDSNFTESLPADPSLENRTRQVAGAAFSFVSPTPVSRPHLIGWSEELAARFGLAAPSEQDVAMLAGNFLPSGSKPFAARYGGHQFGNWAGQLGDGRAIGLGSLPDREGETWEFQLKGAGPTPYSRRADGRAVLRSSLREFVCSEAMHALGVPTTRALSVVGTGDPVLRDLFYDGNAAHEPGAIVCRVAPSFLRFGNFELPASRGEEALLKNLLDYTLANFYPEIPAGPERYLLWFRAVVARTARLMNEWMRVGFVHGVMNTDNLSILGLTIDYGPYGWMDAYDPSWTPNTTDLPGRRYCFGRQPSIAQWNLAQLANAIASLVPNPEQELQKALDEYARIYQEGFLRTTEAKLGLSRITAADEPLLEEMEKLLRLQETDMTLFHRGLAQLSLSEVVGAIPAWLQDSFYSGSAGEEARWLAWLERYRERSAGEDPAARVERMNAANPLYVPRNYLVQQTIEAATAGDAAPLGRLLAVLQNPYRPQAGAEKYALKRPEWARDKPGCSALSCSS